ncbi:hypothetical protein AAFC00_005864 [Neodothiora populina]|uniref:Bromo domain-containing protein n=1 Tax=Neodothiora populina TaxID=2781224 RepID=A0ABR3P7F2_9PEZI
MSGTIHRDRPRHLTGASNASINRAKSAHGTSPARAGPRSVTRAGSIGSITNAMAPSEAEVETIGEDDPVHLLLKEKWSHSESRIADLFRDVPDTAQSPVDSSQQPDNALDSNNPPPGTAPEPAPRRPARTIDEDDYGDDDDEDEDENGDGDNEATSVAAVSPSRPKDKPPMSNGSPSLALRPIDTRTSATSSTDLLKSSEDVRKKLEEDKRAAEEAAKRSFHTTFYTLEFDRDAMLEQQKLDELDRQVENEMSHAQGPTSASGATNTQAQGSLSNADLGASSLTLKNLIARIDAKRNLVNANDTQLRTLISEVRKGRSKWASEDKIGQEELYEASEKVLMELKAMTEYSTPFLQRVNKRDAPDYFHIIKHPMDIGSMIKKLKSLAYKSKKEFVSDLSLIWTNCLTYNADPNHPLRKKALYMRKETDKLVPLIPDIVVRDRAEVEAEERRLQNLDVDLDGGEDSDDDQPIMASRGRKAPSKGKKGQSATHRKGPETDLEATPAVESKPALHASTNSLRNEFLRAESDAPLDASSNGFSTPPPPGLAGTATPFGTNGLSQSQSDAMDIDGTVTSISLPDDADEDDAEFKTWKQVTKKDRAMAAAERNRLFRGDHLNVDEPALLRSKAGMRRWLRQQQQFDPDKKPDAEGAEPETTSTGQSLAEGIEKDQDLTLPDYYDALTSIPSLGDALTWTEDSEGKVVPQKEEYLRLFLSKSFKPIEGSLNRRVEANMRQMQETRKVCAKIGIVKQMQIQAQTYQNQFQKYDPEPFVEQDVGPLAVSEDGPLMSPWVNRAAFQRAVGKIFYHAGFEDFQPSALEAATDVAADFFSKLIRTFTTYRELPKDEEYSPHYTAEEQVLHTLHRNGLDLDSLETYVKDDVERLNSKLLIVHERMKAHLADLLRPALGENVGADGAGAFQDGSDQFVGGDFAEDIDEDFFGFKELGLADEFGLESLSVPLHLLQNRMHSAYQAHNTHSVVSSGVVFPLPQPYEPITTDNLPSQIGLVRDFFATKLAANQGRPLIEDEDLPQKQRFPRPRLPPNGRISSPRKRPIREQQQAAKKKRKLEESKDDNNKGSVRPIAPLKLPLPEKKEATNEPEKETGAMMSPPESITAS